jgi:hypothetical protein
MPAPASARRGAFRASDVSDEERRIVMVGETRVASQAGASAATNVAPVPSATAFTAVITSMRSERTFKTK